jgi:hypothetical protein
MTTAGTAATLVALLAAVAGAAACAGEIRATAADPERPADGGRDGGDRPAPDAGPDAFVPEAVPVLDDEPAPPCAGPHPPDRFQFLDDVCGARRVPTHVDRDLACPTLDESADVPLAGGGSARYRPSSEPIVIEDVLGDIVPPELDVVVILVRRVDGVPHYRYLSNGSAARAVQPWSTSKFLAAANAGARLRELSGGAVGLTAAVDGIPLGDLVTAIADYEGAPYSSNALGRFMHDVGGRARANALVHEAWLGRPAEESFGGNYGEPAPPLGHTFVEPDGASVTVAPDGSAGPANRLSMLTLAEALRRIVLHREEPAQRLPGLTWADARVLLYGAEGSPRSGEWGGLTADDAVYLQSAHDWDYIERRSRGRWRTFSKLGMGSDGQFLDVGYACLPVLDPAGAPVPGWGRELVIAAHLPAGGASWAERDRILARAFRAIVVRVVDGRL